MIRLTEQRNSIILPVRVTPKGGKDAFLPFQAGDEWIKVKVSAPPEDGKANAAVIALLAGKLKLPKGAFTLISGESSRLKRIQIATPDIESLMDLLASLLASEAALCFSRRNA